MKQPPDPATRISKRLSFILRHQPQSIGITLDAQGWTDVAILLQQLNAHGTAIDRALLDHVVATNPKQRFSYDASGTKIRANQGHSVAIDLAYTPCVPRRRFITAPHAAPSPPSAKAAGWTSARATTSTSRPTWRPR